MTQRLIIIGGGAAGSSVAAKAKRVKPDLEVHMFDQGPHVSYSACPTPYYIGGVIPDAEQLIARRPEQFEKSGIHVHLNTGIVSLDPQAGRARDSQGQDWPFDQAAYTTGAHSFIPSIPGIEHEGVFALKDLRDAMRIKDFIREHRARRGVILGAGLIAMEMAEAFRELDLATTILYRGTLPLKKLGEDFARIVLQELESRGVAFLPGTEVMAIERGERGLEVVTADRRHEADLVLVALGILPATRLAAASGLRLGASQAVATDAQQRTNFENVYTAGDCAEAFDRVARRPDYFPFGDVANRQGRVAGANIAGQAAAFPGVVGSWCCKVFGLEVAQTGLTEEAARAAGFQPTAAQVTARSRAHAYPGSQPVQIRLIAEQAAGRLLGAQAVGAEGAVTRVNVVAAGLHCGMTVADLAQIDLCYAPPYSPSWDPLHLVAAECLKKLPA
ncbi:MAG: FAD-dependent oxidoreductase [Candidatus Eisenbacteria bacterium]